MSESGTFLLVLSAKLHFEICKDDAYNHLLYIEICMELAICTQYIPYQLLNFTDFSIISRIYPKMIFRGHPRVFGGIANFGKIFEFHFLFRRLEEILLSDKAPR